MTYPGGWRGGGVVTPVDPAGTPAIIDLWRAGVRSSASPTSNRDAILNALNAVPASMSAELVLPADVITTAPLVLPDRARAIVGRDAGVGGVLRSNGLNGLLKLADGSDADLLTVAGMYWTVKDLGLDGNRENNAAGSCLRVSKPRTTLENLNIGWAYEHGIINEGASGVDQAHAMLANKLYIRSCHGKGFYNKGLYAPDLQAELVWVGACDGDGIAIESVSAILSNLHPWGNAGDGLRVSGGHATISGIYSETNTGHGVHFATGANGGKLSDFWIWKNTQHGVFLENLIGKARIGISRGELQDMVGYGIVGQNSSHVTVSGVHSHDEQAVKTQGYGIQTNGTSDFWIVTGNVILAADHRVSSKALVGAGNVVANNLE